MAQGDLDTLRDAERLMKAHRYGEAIALFEARLAHDREDLRALLELGLCHLLNRSESSFVEIYRRARQTILSAGEVPPGVARLWDQYQELFRKVTATALVVGTVAGLAACSSDDDKGGNTVSSHRYSGGVLVDVVTPEDAADADATSTLDAGAQDSSSDTVSAHRYSGGVFVDAAEQDTSSDAVSAHRYSGGVFVDAAEPDATSSDGHRYSAGMFAPPRESKD